MTQTPARRRGQRPPKAERPRLLPPVEALSVKALGRLLHHQDPRLRKLAEEERSRRANLRRGLAGFDRLTGARDLRRSAAQAKAVLAALPLGDAVKARILRLLRRAPLGRRFRDSEEAPEVAKLVTACLEYPGKLIELLRKAEESGRLPLGTANDLAEARSVSPFFEKAGRLVRELELERLAPEIRGYLGRPSAFRWARLADAISTEIKKESPRRVWPLVADVLHPLIEASGDKIYTDAGHIRQLVDRLNRQRRRKRATLALPSRVE